MFTKICQNSVTFTLVCNNVNLGLLNNLFVLKQDQFKNIYNFRQQTNNEPSVVVEFSILYKLLYIEHNMLLNYYVIIKIIICINYFGGLHIKQNIHNKEAKF